MTRISKTLVMTTGLVVMCGSVAFGTRLGGQSEDSTQASQAASFKCSNRTLNGTYGFSIDGTIMAGTPNAALLRGLAMTHYDGNGNLSQLDFTTRNGVPFSPDWRSGVGTYEVNPDCTGSALIIQSDGTPSVNLRMVIVDRGRQIRTAVVGTASGSTGIRVD